MTGHQRADQVVPTGVVATHVSGVVDGDDPAARLLVALECRLLRRVPWITGGLKHDEGVVLLETFVGEALEVLGVD